MKVDALAFDTPLGDVPATARAAEEAGADGWFTAETAGDPFITVALAAGGTHRIQVGTGIAVAFARSPMDVAYSANDLQQLSGGRFVLGLGSQIEPHITRRFSMPWSRPAARNAFTTERYLREVTLPALEEGAARADRQVDEVDVALGVFLASGYDEEEQAASEAFVRGHIAFYASTPAYRPVLDRHGWGELGEELTRRSRAGEWDRMAELVDDDVLHTFAVVGPPEELADRTLARYGDVVDRVSLYTSFRFRGDDGHRFRAALAGREPPGDPGSG